MFCNSGVAVGNVNIPDSISRSQLPLEENESLMREKPKARYLNATIANVSQDILRN